MNAIEQKIALSDSAFMRHASSLVKSHLGADRIIPVREAGGSHEAKLALDRCSGIDFLARVNGSLVGIANRTRYDRTVYQSCTLRLHPTGNGQCEFHKRVQEIIHPGAHLLWPAYTVYTTVSDESSSQCLAVYLVQTFQMVAAALDQQNAAYWTVQAGNDVYLPFLNLWHPGLIKAGVTIVPLIQPTARIISGLRATSRVNLLYPDCGHQAPVPFRHAA
jgi:hypothetical protein